MIKNERQYKITKRWLRDFKSALKQVAQKEPDVDPLLIEVEMNAIRSQISEFKNDIRQYERLKVRKKTTLKSVYQIGEMLVMARIMSKMTQKQLASKIGVAEQQVQRWEDNNYESTSLHTIFEIAKQLNITSTTFYISI